MYLKKNTLKNNLYHTFKYQPKFLLVVRCSLLHCGVKSLTSTLLLFVMSKILKWLHFIKRL